MIGTTCFRGTHHLREGSRKVRKEKVKQFLGSGAIRRARKKASTLGAASRERGRKKKFPVSERRGPGGSSKKRRGQT